MRYLVLSGIKVRLAWAPNVKGSLTAGLMLCTFLVFTCIAIPNSAFAQTAQETLQTDSTVIFGGSGYYPPFHFYNDAGQVDGFDVNIFSRLAQISGWSMGFRLDDWQSVQQDLQTGDVDIVPMFVSEERQALYLFSNPLHLEYHLLFGPANSPSYDSISALTTERVAAEGGAYATNELLKTNPGITIVDADSEAAALDLVDRGHADLALLPSEIGRYNLRTRRLDHLAALSPPLLPVAYAFAINPARPELVSQVNAGIEQMQRRGELEQLLNQWLHTPAFDAQERALLILRWTMPLLLALAAATFLVIKFYRIRLEEMQLLLHGKDNHFPVRTTSETKRIVHSLTGLPERKDIQQQLDYEVTVAKHRRSTCGFTVIGLINLDALQDAFDEEAGDDMVKALAVLIPDDWRARGAYIGPGLFGFTLDDAEHAEQRISSLMITLSQSVLIRDMNIHPRLCAGLALYPEHANTAQELIHKAKMAMNQAKRIGNNLLVYSADIKPDPRRIPVISDLRQALAQHQIQWALQPQYKVSEKRIVGAELLARWNHHKHGWLPPGDFIVWAEEAGMISQVTDMVINETASLFQTMPSHDDFYFSINLSAFDLGNDTLIEALIHKISGKYAGHLTVEVTETALMLDKKAALRNIDRLKSANFRVALDDYGTGYASLEYLQSFNFDEIKIDRRFINNIATVARDRKLTQASIELGHQLGSTVVAEGVENEQTAAMLIDMGCDLLQGYHIGHPVLLGDINTIRNVWR
ncbi:MAG: EAL domain-containing protein [Pseudohongiella sp.]|nr:EAL domain-containing protein [Pseudohongiella sp.]